MKILLYVGIIISSLIALTTPHFVCLSAARSWILNIIYRGIFMFSDLTREMIVVV